MKAVTFSALVAAVAAALVFGVGSAAGGKQDLINVKYTTSFGTFGREAYAYVALDRGYFARAGLNVTITPGLGTLSDATLVASGQTDFSPGDTTAMALAVANSGLPVKCVAPIQEVTMNGYFSYGGSGINSWKSFEGHTIGDTPGSTGTVIFPYVAKKAGIDASKVTFVPTTPQTGPALFAAHKIDIFAQFVVGKPTVEAAVGNVPLNMFSVANVVPGMLGNCLMVSDKTLASNPTLVRRFTWALLQGLKWSLDNPVAAGQILQKYVPLQNATTAAGELTIMKKYVVTKDVIQHGFGYVNPRHVASTVSIVNSFFHPKTRLTVSDIWAFGFQPKPVIKP